MPAIDDGDTVDHAPEGSPEPGPELSPDMRGRTRTTSVERQGSGAECGCGETEVCRLLVVLALGENAEKVLFEVGERREVATVQLTVVLLARER